MGMRPTITGAIQLIAARSRRTSSATCGRCTLTTTLSPVAQRRRVHLRNRGGRKRRDVEGGEDLLERPTEVVFDDGAHGGEGLRRDAVAQLAELGNELLGEDALARAEDLAELDVGRTQRAERLLQPSRQPGARVAGVARAACRGAATRPAPGRAASP